LGEVYKNNRDSGVRKAITQYWGFLPLCGGCFTAGAAYFGGNLGGFIKEFGSQIPYLIGSENTAYSVGERLSDVIADSLHNGYDTGSQLAAIGFFAGIFLTVRFKNSIKSLFGK